eukprot:1047073-Amphidinium_carterae.1
MHHAPPHYGGKVPPLWRQGAFCGRMPTPAPRRTPKRYSWRQPKAQKYSSASSRRTWRTWPRRWPCGKT